MADRLFPYATHTGCSTNFLIIGNIRDFHSFKRLMNIFLVISRKRPVQQRLVLTYKVIMQRILKKMRLYRIHDSLSNVTNKRKACMPWEGTFDFWVLLGITLMNLLAVGIGLSRLIEKEGSLNTPVFTTVNGCQSQNVQLIALVFAFIEATPGLLFIMYVL